MTEIILQSLMMFSLGAMLYLMLKALPKINDKELETPRKQMGTQSFAIYLEKIDERLRSFLVKILRRLRLTILKFDNMIGERLKQFKKEEPRGAAFQEEPPKENGPT